MDIPNLVAPESIFLFALEEYGIHCYSLLSHICGGVVPKTMKKDPQKGSQTIYILASR